MTFRGLFNLEVLLIVLLGTPFVAYNVFMNNQAARNTSAKSVTANLGMTLEQFKAAYEMNATDSDMSSVSLNNCQVETTDNRTSYYFDNLVVMAIDTDISTGLIERITVVCEPQKHRNYTKTEILLMQTSIYSVAMMAFNPNIKNQKYRESMIKRLYSNANNDYMAYENVKFFATIYEGVFALHVIPKKSPAKSGVN